MGLLLFLMTMRAARVVMVTKGVLFETFVGVRSTLATSIPLLALPGLALSSQGYCSMYFLLNTFVCLEKGDFPCRFPDRVGIAHCRHRWINACSLLNRAPVKPLPPQVISVAFHMLANSCFVFVCCPPSHTLDIFCCLMLQVNLPLYRTK